MPNLHIVGEPRMTTVLVAAGAFTDDPVVVVDVGARGGVEWHWKVFGDHVRIIAFEPDAEECARLNAKAERNVTYMPAALGREDGPRTLYVTHHAASSTFYPTVPEWGRRYTFADNLAVDHEVTVQTSTLRTALAGRRIDFMKLDAEGAELDVLQGADLAPVLGLISELNFGQSPSGQPSFADFDAHCRANGLQLYDLDLYRFSRQALPYPLLYDSRDAAGRPVAGPTIQGQVLSSDALYFRDGLASAQPVKHACLFEIFGLADCAAEMILAHRAAFARWVDPDHLLDLLVPEVKGRRLAYADYVARHRAGDPLFRPTPGWRQPPRTVDRYDGIFIPAWLSLGPRLQRLWRALRRRV
ncbi:MAG: FkbM family methyltransferase [Pseudomonadota bacterium]